MPLFPDCLKKSSYHNLPEVFYQRAELDHMPSPSLLIWNQDLAKHFRIDEPTEKDLLDFLQSESMRSLKPIALNYSGHQFGYFNSQLGDGRALLVGSVSDSAGIEFDVQLKGSGPTAYSRGGDGKSPLGPVLREYLVSEAMHAFHIPTTRSLFAIRSGEMVWREAELPGGLLARTALSHIRCGTFEYFAARNDIANLRVLLNYAVARNYPDLEGSNELIPQFYQRVCSNMARLVSQWMAVGFIHGVMNTDNIAVSGETLDYGPCAFMDEYRSDKTFSSIDRKGRYAYDKQADIMKWNLGILLECLALLADGPAVIEQLKNIWQNFKKDYESHFSEAFAKKLGFLSASKEDSKIVQKWLSYLESKSLDFTGSFSALSQLAAGKAQQLPLPETPEFNDFYALWRARIDQQDPHQTLATLQSANPYYIPRNHIIEEVITKANEGDFGLFYDMLRVVKKPFEVQDNTDRFALAPSIEERVQKTFCGT